MGWDEIMVTSAMNSFFHWSFFLISNNQLLIDICSLGFHSRSLQPTASVVPQKWRALRNLTKKSILNTWLLASWQMPAGLMNAWKREWSLTCKSPCFGIRFFTISLGVYFPYHPWDWYIYLYIWLSFMLHVGKYTVRPMDASWVWDSWCHQSDLSSSRTPNTELLISNRSLWELPNELLVGGFKPIWKISVKLDHFPT